MAHPSIIAIHGRAGAGKDVIAGHLAKRHGYTVVKVAAPIKAMLEAALFYGAGLGGEDVGRCLEGDLKETPVPRLGGHTPRYAMQVLGGEFQDAICPELFARTAVLKAQMVVVSGGRVVIDDLRYPAEVRRLRGLGASFWRVDRPAPYIRPDAVPDLPWDPTEPSSVPQGALHHMVHALLQATGVDEQDVFEQVAGYQGRRAARSVRRSLDKCHALLSDVWLGRLRESTPPARHVSERGLPPGTFDVVLVNCATSWDLRSEVDQALDRVPKKGSGRLVHYGVTQWSAA